MIETLFARLEASVDQAASRDTDQGRVQVQEQDQDQDETSANSLRFLRKLRIEGDDTEVVMASVSTVSFGKGARNGDVDDGDGRTLGVEHAEVGLAMDHIPYRMYKRRYIGLVALIALNFVGGMSNPWFGPIASNMTRDFGFSLDQVNWLGNVVNIAFLPFSLIVPLICTRWGIRITCYLGAVFLFISAWVRYAGTAHTLSKSGAYGLIMIGQILSGIAQPAFQVIGPLFSETWFDLKSRTTVTMVLSIANPVGGAVAQILSPSVYSTRTSILLMGIIATAAVPCVFFVGEAPPTPPTHSASRSRSSILSLLSALLGREPHASPHYMTVRERIDFCIITIVFGVLVGVVTSFSILTDQDFGPYGYSNDTSGLMGATLLFAGVAAAVVTSPLFDRVLTRHMALTCKILCPILGGLWFSLIWATKPNNTGALFAIFALIGTASITILPVGLELAMEVTRNAGSSAILWLSGNLVSISCVLIEGALRAGPDANPPNNMHHGIIYQGVLVCSAVVWIFALRGKQARRELDERAIEEARHG